MKRKLCDTIEEQSSSEALLSILTKLVNFIFKLTNERPQLETNFKEIESGIVTAVQLLINAGADVYLKDENGDTPLHLAARIANVQLIKFLVTRGIDVNVKNSKTDMTPLHTLMSSIKHRRHEDELLLAQADALEVLLSANANVNAVEKFDGKTPLHNFIHANYYDYHGYSESFFKIIKIFIKFKADFRIKNLEGETPMKVFLRSCNDHNNFNYSKVLLETLIKYDIMDVDDLFLTRRYGAGTILHEACSSLNYNMMKFLVNYGADIEVVDYYGKTPLLKLIVRLCSFQIDNREINDDFKKLDYFLSLNPDINVMTNDGLHILNLNDNYVDDDDGDELIEYPEFLWKALIEYIAKKQSTGYLLHNSIVQFISRKKKYKTYLDKCKKELKNFQVLKFPWLNLHEILMDPKKKLDSYVKNKVFTREFNELLLVQKYPIYGPHIVKRFSKALQKQEVKKKSAVILSSCLPYHMDPSHLIIKKIVDCLKAKYLRYLCEPESKELKIKIRKEVEVDEFRISLSEYVCNCYKIE